MNGRRAAGAAGAVGAVGLAAIMVLAGCSGGSGASGKTNAAATTAASSGTASSGTASSASARAAGGAADFQAYAQCLQQHGVTVPSVRPSFSRQPNASGSPRPRPTGSFSRPPGGGFLGSASADPSVQAAMQACASLRPSGGAGGGFARRSISPTTLAAFKSCMSDNGVATSGTDAQQILRALDRNDPKTAAALRICQPILGTAAESRNPPASQSA